MLTKPPVVKMGSPRAYEAQALLRLAPVEVFDARPLVEPDPQGTLC